MLYIYHHLGLGDHLMCNGLVRELIKNEANATLFCKPHNIESVKFMYSDVANLEFMEMYDDEVLSFISDPNIRSVKIGHAGVNFPDMPGSYPVPNENDVVQTFYRQGGIAYNKRWSSWHVDRNYESEKALLSKIGLSDGERYIFVHDDPSRNYNIKNENVRSDLRIIKPNLEYTKNIFDYCYLLENAEEIHCMDSSFRILCEHINTTGTLHFHQYAKGSSGWGVPLSRKRWIFFVN